MTYRIKGGQSVADAVGRIGADQLDKAIEETGGRDLDEAVHDVRKRCKKLRGMIRLVRPCFAAYDEENADFRDTARLLARSRDAAVRLATFDKLAEASQLAAEVLDGLRRRLAQQHDEVVMEGVDAEAQLAAAKGRLIAARGRVDRWELSEKGFAAVAGGLKKTYGRCRKAMAEAAANPTMANLHEWRKRVKYHWYHCRLLREVWPGALDARRQEADNLGDLLGNEHDLAVLATSLRELADDEAAKALLDELDRRRASIQREAHDLGRRLFAEKPGAFVARIESYWDTWRRLG